MLKLKDRISILKNATTDANVVNIATMAAESCKSSEVINSIIAESLIKDLEPFAADDAVKKFISRETRLCAINNLGIKDLVKKITESELIQNQSVKYALNSFVGYLQHNPEYFLAKPFMEQFKNISWHKDVKEGFAKIEENLKKYEDDINLCSFIHEFKLSTGDYLSNFFINEFDTYFIERDEYSKKKLLEKIQPYLHDTMLNGLNKFLRESMGTFQACSDNVADINNIYSPVIIKENEEIFYSSGRFIKKSNNKLFQLTEREIKDLPQAFIMMAEFVNRPNVKVSEDAITIYTSDKKVKIMKEGNNTILILNDKQIAPQAFSRFFMNEGIFRPSDNDILANCMNLFENYDNIYEIDYGKRISSKIYENQWVDVFKIGKTVAVNKVDGFNKTNDFISGINALQTKNLVYEHIGFDMSKSFRDLLPEEQTKVDNYKKEIVEIDEAIQFLTSKRDAVLNETNASPILRNDKNIINLISVVNDELVALKEKKLIIKNTIAQFETVNIGFAKDEYVSENHENEIDEFWKDSSNKNKIVYFAQVDDSEGINGKYIVGSQSYKDYKDSRYWEILDTNLSRDAAIKTAKDLAKNTKGGLYFETDDVKESVSDLSEESMHKETEEAKKELKESEEKKNDNDPDGVDKLNKKDINAAQNREKEHPSNENELQPGDKIKMKNGKIGIVNSVNNANGGVVVNMEDGKSVAVPKQYLNELEIIEKKTKESNPEVKTTDGTQSVQIEENSSEWIDGEMDGKKIKVLALDYTSKGDDEDVTVKVNNKEETVKKSLVKVKL